MPSALPSRSGCGRGSTRWWPSSSGFVDHTVDQAAGQVMASGGQIAEAVRRRRLEAGSDDVFLERLLGLSLTRAQVDRGVAFVEGVIEREGEDGPGPAVDLGPRPAHPGRGGRARPLAGPPRGRRGAG